MKSIINYFQPQDRPAMAAALVAVIALAVLSATGSI